MLLCLLLVLLGLDSLIEVIRVDQVRNVGVEVL